MEKASWRLSKSRSLSALGVERGRKSTDVIAKAQKWAARTPQICEPITARRPNWSFRGRNCTKVQIRLSAPSKIQGQNIDIIKTLFFFFLSHQLSKRRKSPAMPAKKNAAREPAPSAAATTQSSTTAAASVPPTQLKPASTPASAPSAKNTPANWDKVLQNIYDYYMNETPQRTKLIDVFLVFIAVVGALQFLYCILAGNYVRGRDHDCFEECNIS